MSDLSDRRSNLLLGGSGGDRFVEYPVQCPDEPVVAGERFVGGLAGVDCGDSGVDAGDEVVGQSERYLLHAAKISQLTSDITCDIILGMTTTTYTLNRKTGSTSWTKAISRDSLEVIYARTTDEYTRREVTAELDRRDNDQEVA